MGSHERPIVFDCAGETLFGIVSVPRAAGSRGVLIVVGGPQYRVGSHRQFTLLARHLSAAGVPVLRFDYRGMGDSSGAARTFEDIDSDIRCAIDRFFAAVPDMRDIVIWGLCDAASAALFYAHRDARVSGLVLANPWVRTEQGEARAYLRHYYVNRILQAEFWRKLARGDWDMRAAASSLRGFVAKAGLPRSGSKTNATADLASQSLPDRMAEGLRRFGGPVLLILSGNDLVAQEFRGLANAARWQQLLGAPRVTRHDISEANHTFARRIWRDEVAAVTASWLKSW